MSSYVLITPARNEEAYIERTLQSVAAQTILPKKWVIVSDGSTDRTDAIIDHYAQDYSFIRHVRVAGHDRHNFRSKVAAINAGCAQLGNLEYEFWGNLDADVSFAPNYFEKLLIRFQKNPRLGIGGGLICERRGQRFQKLHYNLGSVAGAVQMFRRECYEKIGGYPALNNGGADAVVEVVARMHSWEVQTFPELQVFHHRLIGASANNRLLARFFSWGETNYLIGAHPLFYTLKCLFKAIEKPYIVGGVSMLWGFLRAWGRGDAKSMPPEFIQYFRAEQMQRLRALPAKLWKHITMKNRPGFSP